MSTDSTPSADGQPSSDQPTSGTDTRDTPPAGFAFSGVSHHEIEEAYSWRYVDRIVADGRSITRIDDSDGYFAEDSEYSCTCGEEFDTEKEAISHLRKHAIQRLPPLPEQPRPITWDDNIVELHGQIVSIQVDVTNTFGRVESDSGAGFLAATARERYNPPADFDFESWEPLISGRLQFPNGAPLFRPPVLAQALGELVEGGDYIPARYTLHFRGEKPLLMEGPDGAIVVAPQTRSES